jgi:flagellar motor switch protein FliM
MNVKIAEIPLNVADLTTIKPGDILPIAMPDTFLCISGNPNYLMP